jgi:hypothetical protein
VSFTFFPKLPIPSSANAFRSEHRELPGVGSLIVANEIRITVCASQLEISVVGRQPGVEYLRDGYPTVTKNQRAWRLLAAMAGVALNTNAKQPLFTHLIHHTTLVRSEC